MMSLAGSGAGSTPDKAVVSAGAKPLPVPR